MHIVSLSFDDGFEDSFLRVADIYERCGLTACLNIVATRPGPGYAEDVEGVPDLPLTNFALWNGLVARGHEIMPHSYCHKNLPGVSLETAAALIERGLQIIAANLDGYDASRAQNLSMVGVDFYRLPITQFRAQRRTVSRGRP